MLKHKIQKEQDLSRQKHKKLHKIRFKNRTWISPISLLCVFFRIYFYLEEFYYYFFWFFLGWGKHTFPFKSIFTATNYA